MDGEIWLVRGGETYEIVWDKERKDIKVGRDRRKIWYNKR